MKRMFATLIVAATVLATDKVEAVSRDGDEYLGGILAVNLPIDLTRDNPLVAYGFRNMEVSYGFHALDVGKRPDVSFYARFLAAPFKPSFGGGFGFGFTPPKIGHNASVGLAFEIRGWDKNAPTLDGGSTSRPEVFRLFLTLRGHAGSGWANLPEIDLGIEDRSRTTEGIIFCRVGMNFDADWLIGE